MSLVSEKGHLILAGNGNPNSSVYRGILELVSRFGYISIREVQYGYDLSLQPAINRLFYLEKAGLIQKFPSYTIPDQFYCLTSFGRQAVQTYRISDEIHNFRPHLYSPIYQHHNRTLIKAYQALRKIFGDNFLSWASEMTLKREAGKMGISDSSKGRRIFDGLFNLMMKITKYRRESDGKMHQWDHEWEPWSCGLEVELTLKSPKRYKKQFEDLARGVYSTYPRQQRVPTVLFLYSTQTIFDRLVKHIGSGRYSFGECYFALAQVDEFLRNLGDAWMYKVFGNRSKESQVHNLNHVQIEVIQR